MFNFSCIWASVNSIGKFFYRRISNMNLNSVYVRKKLIDAFDLSLTTFLTRPKEKKLPEYSRRTLSIFCYRALESFLQLCLADYLARPFRECSLPPCEGLFCPSWVFSCLAWRFSAVGCRSLFRLSTAVWCVFPILRGVGLPPRGGFFSYHSGLVGESFSNFG